MRHHIWTGMELTQAERRRSVEHQIRSVEMRIKEDQEYLAKLRTRLAEMGGEE